MSTKRDPSEKKFSRYLIYISLRIFFLEGFPFRNLQ